MREPRRAARRSRTMCSNAFTPRWAWPTCASRPRGLDAQRDRAAARVPDHAAGRLGGDHRQRVGVDQPGLAQVPRAGHAAGLLVADEVQHDPAVAEQPELARRGGAVEHADQAALHVGGAAPGDPAVAPLRAELRRDPAPGRRRSGRGSRPCRGPSPTPPRTMHGSSSSRLGASSISSGARPSRCHRVVQEPSAPAEPATGRVLGVDGDELLEQRGHLIGARLQPGLHLGGAIHQRLPSHRPPPAARRSAAPCRRGPPPARAALSSAIAARARSRTSA